MIRNALSICLVLVFMNNVGKGQINEILGRPTDHSVTVNVVFNDTTEFFCEYALAGDTKMKYTDTLFTFSKSVGEIVIDGLNKDSEYIYRTAYRKVNSGSFQYGEYHRFHTQRSRESSFTFVIEADPHPYDKKCYHPLWNIALDNQLADKPDFMIDMGDTFGDDHNPFTITQEEIDQLHLDNREYFGRVGHSVPLFFCLGNHEGESGYYLLQTPPENLGVWGTLSRKLYYPNPFPDDFYTGNSNREEYGIDYPENYYAWEWGDALFIVLDAYRYYTVNAKPRNWDWTIGKDQYDWLKQTLEQSNASFKFVFMHQIMGENRGGALLVKGYEWGGYDKDGTKWTFTENRPGWEMPIHQLMVKNKVNIFFEGHSHLYAQEEVDGIIYQTVPMPSDSSYQLGVVENADAYTGTILKGSGHLRVEVTTEKVTVDFVNAVLPKDESAEMKNGDVSYSYSIDKTGSVSSASELKEMNVHPALKIYPNPSREQVTISFSMKKKGNATFRIYDTSGKLIAMWVENNLKTGDNMVVWDPKRKNGKAVKPGTYICSISIDKKLLTEKMVIVQ
ncbi:T9SS type A sorting domain-containing protein [Roseimarinus sediminis]|uniref:T9SS type A sorting domain-containing protein n=1 Tax=Roseimarinus sediminis TaxID=1610899 RepID=UPI003D2313EE